MSIEQKENGKWLVRLTVPTAKRNLNGKLIRKNLTKTFDNKTAAEIWEKNKKQSLLAQGTESAMSGLELAEFREAKSISGGVDLREVAKFYSQHNPKGVKKTLNEVIDLYVESPKWLKLAATTRVNHMTYLNAFKKTFGGAKVAEIGLEAVEDYLNQIPHEVSRHSHGSFLKGFFTWMSQRRQQFIVINPLVSLQLNDIHYGAPDFVILNDVKKLFEVAVENDPSFIPYMALGFFGGLRTSEIDRLDKKHFLLTDRHINVAAEVAKRKRQGRPLPRLLDGLPETLWLWLSASQFNGEIDKVNRVKRYRRIYAKAEVERLHSGARHTFATYAYAYTQDAGQVRKWTGHRGNDSVFLTHYAGLVEKKAGGDYFATIKPPAAGIPLDGKIYKNRKRKVSDDAIKEAFQKTAGNKSKAAILLGISEAAVRSRLKKMTNYECRK